MTPREKILFILEEIFKHRKLALSEELIIIKCHDLEKKLDADEVSSILNKLMCVEKVINLYYLGYFDDSNNELAYKIQLTPKFEQCYYGAVTGKGSDLKSFRDNSSLDAILKSNSKISETEDDNEILYELKYHDLYCQISINGILLKNPQYGAVNSIVFEYLYNKPDKDVSFNELNEVVKANLDKNLDKPLKKIAHELGFVGDRKKLFFITTKNSARLRTKITKKDLIGLNIDISKILPKK